MTHSLGHKAVSGAIWASINRFGSMSMQFVVNIILARLLLPADFGMIGMLTIFIAISQTLIDGGFGSALIQKKNPTQKDYSTIFFWNLFFSGILYLILFLCAPLIAEFYSMPNLSSVLRVLALSLILSGIVSIQKVRLQKELAFKIIAVVDLVSYALTALIAIYLADRGLGAWSLVIMQLAYIVLSIIMLSFITHWKPSLYFSKTSLKELFGFGGFIMAANILQTVCSNVQGLIIGKRFSATQMGYFSQAYKLDLVTSYSIPQVIVQVMYPIYSSIQDDKARLNSIVLMNMRVIAFIVFPILSILILSAEPLITLLYGEKWLPSVPYFRILCVGGFFVCLQNLNYYAVAAVGKSKSLFKWSFYKWGFLLVALLIGMNFGMYGILWGMVLSNLNIFLTNAFLSSKHTGLSLLNQILAILPLLLISLIIIGSGIIMQSLDFSVIITCTISLLLYFGISYIVRLRATQETISVILRLIHH